MPVHHFSMGDPRESVSSTGLGSSFDRLMGQSTDIASANSSGECVRLFPDLFRGLGIQMRAAGASALPPVAPLFRLLSRQTARSTRTSPRKKSTTARPRMPARPDVKGGEMCVEGFRARFPL